MAENGNSEWRRRVDDALVDARNEAIVQGANLYLAGRRIVLVSAGLAMLGADEVQKLFQRAAERGEVMEQDALTAIDQLRHRPAEDAGAAPPDPEQ